MDHLSRSPMFWHPSRRGTLIVGEPRSGTHFLQKVVRDHVQDFMSVTINNEIDLDLTPGQRSPTANRLSQLEEKDGYQVAIVNSSHGKAQLIADPDLLCSWYVIRVTRLDKVSWFRSWAMFNLHALGEGKNAHGTKRPEMQFLHHDTPEEVYRAGIKQHGPLVLDARLIAEACANLSLHRLGDLVPCEETLDYDDLHNYETEHTLWMNNQYPRGMERWDHNFESLFTNWEDILPILEAWSPESKNKSRRPPF